jgi:hypothetical protein
VLFSRDLEELKRSGYWLQLGDFGDNETENLNQG